MITIRKLLSIGIIIILILGPFIGKSFAEAIDNGSILKEYVSSGYNDNILEQRNTLLRFQAENNLSVDGIIGDITNEALNKEEKKVIDIIPEEIIEKEWFIVINKTKKILTVYNNGEIYKKYPVALGKDSTPTPDHKFTIINKLKNPYWGGMGGKFKPVRGGAPNNPLGKRWLGLSTEKYRGYGIHGNSAPFSIGRYISAGCIRMINEDVEELFEYMPIKTDVWIGTEEVLEEWGIKQYMEYEKKEEVCSMWLQNIRWQVMI
ncbi:L,D-transpeptidase [Clostridium sp. Cult1]|uniref:L,D-transpeptidase n=1 Tax=Clostridium sp. Cult1 TaxID=2079002 RepID=UPI001F0216CC|nr:L,D-transpeptidase [Clostridium sp. Cult1]MCF6461992.1 L,D-transpeptidase [Clostridium sp. Cult1]